MEYVVHVYIRPHTIAIATTYFLIALEFQYIHRIGTMFYTCVGHCTYILHAPIPQREPGAKARALCTVE